MTASQSNLAGLSRFIFRAPSWSTSVAFALLLAAVAGVGAFERPEAATTWRGVLFVGRDAWEGIFFIGIPTVVASFATTWVDHRVGGRLTHNRSSLLALVCELVIVAMLTVAAALSYLTSLEQRFVFDVLVVSLASVFALRLLVIMAVSGSRLAVAAVPASIQTVTAAALLFVYSGTLRFLEIGGPLFDALLTPYLARPAEAPHALSAIGPNHFLLLGLTSALYGVAVWGFLYVVDRPWRNSLGVSVLDFLGGFIGHIAEGSRELEDFFEQLGEEALVPVTVLSVRTLDGSEEKARWVLPMVHPGPMGEIGGGNLPVRVAEHADGLAFPPHATAGHDFNLVTEREVGSVVEAASRAYDRLEYTTDASHSVQVSAGDATVLGQSFGEDALLVSTFAPGFADDVEYAVGLSAAAEARANGPEEVLLVDAHNSNNGLEGPDLGHVTPGSHRSFDLMGAAGDAANRLAAAPRGDLSVGVAWDTTKWVPPEGIGPLGVRVMVASVDGAETAYVLVDGNNMEPGLRDRLVGSLVTDHVDEAEVMTTDTHIVNTVEADNQVGAAIDHGELETLVGRLVAEAKADLEPAEAGMATERAEVTVFGNDRTETLASHANAAVSMGGALALAVIVSSLAVSVILFFVTGA